jgi:hypothetical protein
MRSAVCWIAVVTLVAGCATHNPVHAQDTSPEPPREHFVPTQQVVLIGKVISVKPELGFVVLNFPVGNVPGYQRHMSVYRQGVKVGEVKVTGPQQEDNVVGDIVSGQLQAGDEIRGN